MWVYGDHVRTVAPRAALADVADTLAALPAGADRPGALADAFVDAAAVAQALIDAEFEARGGVDARSSVSAALMSALTDLAAAMQGIGPAQSGTWRTLAARVPPAPLQARLAEGFAFYALHPLAYAQAAEAAGLGPGTRVVGVRSIGVALAAVVAAAAGAPPPVTVRPVGDPFARRLSLSPELAAELARSPGPIAVVDEGPGLSGSSFLSVADALQAAGIGRERLVLMPSHGGGPGAQASPAALALWREARRAPADADPAERLSDRLLDLTGSLAAPVRELSGGGWRAVAQGAARLAADRGRERRKLLLSGDRATVLVKWAGLGGEARDKLDRARRLAEARWAPPPLALRDGWLVRPWIEGRALGPDDPPPLDELAATLRLRAGWTAPDPGADAAALAEMTRVNVGEALGPPTGTLTAAQVTAGLTGARPAPVWTDSRLHRHEWLRTPDGRTLKTDADDHARAHDLVGCQEIGWDVAGATVEWDLAPTETAALARAADAPPERLPALEIAYLALQLGLWSSARDAATDGAEHARLADLCDGYAAKLSARLGETPMS